MRFVLLSMATARRPGRQHLGFLLAAAFLCKGVPTRHNETAGQPAIAPQFQLVPGTTRKLSQVVGEFDFETGQPTLSRTVTQVNLRGTDGGNSFEHDGKLWFFFGDSDHPFPVPPEMESLNSMAWATVEDPSSSRSSS